MDCPLDEVELLGGCPQLCSLGSSNSNFTPYDYIERTRWKMFGRDESISNGSSHKKYSNFPLPLLTRDSEEYSLSPSPYYHKTRKSTSSSQSGQGSYPIKPLNLITPIM